MRRYFESLRPADLGKNKIDDKALVDLWGVIKVSHAVVRGVSILNFEGFAPAARWEELSVTRYSEMGSAQESGEVPDWRRF